MAYVKDFGFCGGSYLAASAVIDSERSINLYPEKAPDSAKSPVDLIGTPGLQLLTSGLAGQVRALWAGNGRLFAIAGSHGYEINPLSGAVVNDYGAMAGDPGVASIGFPCSIVPNNAGSGGNQLFAVNSYSNQIYQFEPVGHTMVSVFNGTALEYLDGFSVAIAAGASLASATQGNQVNVSKFGDGTTWSQDFGLDYIIRTGAPDLITQLATINEQLWIMGQKNSEIWYNAGNPGFPFARMANATINTGVMAPWTVTKVRNTIAWLGADDRGFNRVYVANGFTPVRISTPAIENMINTLFSVTFSTNAYAYEEAGHTFYVLNFPGAANSGGALVYDFETQLWHERYWNNGGTLQMPRAWCFASINSLQGSAPNELNFVGDWYGGNIYQMGLQFTSDNGTAIKRQRAAPHVADHNRWIKYPSFELDADIGTAQAVLEYSNDGGRTFPHSRAAISASNDQGYGSVGGGFGRFKWWQLGRSRDRVFRVTITDGSNPIRLVNAYLNAVAGTEK